MRFTSLFLFVAVIWTTAFSQSYYILPEDNAISGWKQHSPPCITEYPDSLYYCIDGEAPSYIECGILDFAGSYYYNSLDSNQYCVVRISHFSSDVGSKCMYLKKRSNITAQDISPIPAIGDSAFSAFNEVIVLNHSYLIEVDASVSTSLDSAVHFASFISLEIYKLSSIKSIQNNKFNSSISKSKRKGSIVFGNHSECYLINGRFCNLKSKSQSASIVIPKSTIENSKNEDARAINSH